MRTSASPPAPSRYPFRQSRAPAGSRLPSRAPALTPPLPSCPSARNLPRGKFVTVGAGGLLLLNAPLSRLSPPPLPLFSCVLGPSRLLSNDGHGPSGCGARAAAQVAGAAGAHVHRDPRHAAHAGGAVTVAAAGPSARAAGRCGAARGHGAAGWLVGRARARASLPGRGV